MTLATPIEKEENGYEDRNYPFAKAARTPARAAVRRTFKKERKALRALPLKGAGASPRKRK